MITKIKHPWFYQLSIIGHAHAYSLGMASGLEQNMVVLFQILVDDSGQIVKISEWRLGTEFAVGKKLAKLLFVCQLHRIGTKLAL